MINLLNKFKYYIIAILFILLTICSLILYFQHNKITNLKTDIKLLENANNENLKTIENLKKDIDKYNYIINKKEKENKKIENDYNVKIKKLREIKNEKCIDSPISDDISRLFENNNKN